MSERLFDVDNKLQATTTLRALTPMILPLSTPLPLQLYLPRLQTRYEQTPSSRYGTS